MSDFVPCPVLDGVEQDALSFIEKSLLNTTCRDRQIYLFNGIRILDYLFCESMTGNIDQNEKQELNDAYSYSYPSFLRNLYEDFSLMNDVPLPLIDDANEVFFNRIVYSSQLSGNISILKEKLRSSVLKIELNTKNTVKLKYTDKYPWIETIEQQYLVNFASLVQHSQQKRYQILFNKLPQIIEKMKPLVYIWKDCFIGYTTTEEIDDFYYENALLDATQATEWNMFPENCEFGGITYKKYVDTIVYLISFALKHMQFCYILVDNNPRLKIQNLLTIIQTHSEVLQNISYITGLSIEKADVIFKTLLLDSSNLDKHTDVRSSPPPFIQISKHQYLRSICGCMDRPFEFLLDSLRSTYPKDWDRNTQLRESEFRQQLYDFFPDEKNFKITKPIVISENGKVLTDIDGCIMDKKTGDILFIQLKWQDLTYNSTKSLLSKRSNYTKQTHQWIEIIYHWISNVSDKRIADYLGVPVEAIHKDKIHILILGRFNANFSSSDKPNDKVAWGQWYQTLLYLLSQNEKTISISSIIAYLKSANPFNKQVITHPTIYKIGGKTINIS